MASFLIASSVSDPQLGAYLYRWQRLPPGHFEHGALRHFSAAVATLSPSSHGSRIVTVVPKGTEYRAIFPGKVEAGDVFLALLGAFPVSFYSLVSFASFREFCFASVLHGFSSL